MKNVVINQIGHACEFKPDVLFEKYLLLTQQDVCEGLCSLKQMKPVLSCPACESKKSEKVFSRFGCSYYECQRCGSVYLNPRPSDADIKKHYLYSKSAEFWRRTLVKKTEDKRKEKIYEKRLQWLRDVSGNFLPLTSVIADFNSRDPEYAKELLKTTYFKHKIIVDPYFDYKILDSLNEDMHNVKIIKDLKDALKYKETVNIACSFETMDFFSDIEYLLKSINCMLCSGGLFFLTTISISGFDLQILWENSTSIFPPDRINVFSRDGLVVLFKRYGFEIIEYSTPGFLDLDIVKNTARKNPSIKLPRFVKSILKDGDEQVYHDFQEFLQLSKLSSFTRIVLKKS